MAIVLLVDPSQTIRRVVEMVFKGSGHDVISATSATEGQQAIARYQPSVAIVNYLLPDGSGVELCRLIKANPPTARMGVVVMGGTYAAFDAEQARAAGANAVVMKPFKTAELLDPVVELIGGGDETAATSQSQHASAPAPEPPPAAAPAPPPAPATPPAAAQPRSPPAATPAPERARYAPPAASPSAQSSPTRPGPAAVPRPGAPPPAPQQAPTAAGHTAAYRGQPSTQAPSTSDVTQRAVIGGPAAAVDRETVRALVEDMLPQIALDTLQQMLADWLEARLRNYIHELVRQELSRYQRQ